MSVRELGDEDATWIEDLDGDQVVIYAADGCVFVGACRPFEVCRSARLDVPLLDKVIAELQRRRAELDGGA